MIPILEVWGVKVHFSWQATQLEFNQAMTDFKIMFPNMDIDVIEAVLRYRILGKCNYEP